MPYRHEPNYIFSVMGFPSLDRKTGRHTEYCEVLGQTVILPEREWLQLPEKFVLYFWRSSAQPGDGSSNEAPRSCSQHARWTTSKDFRLVAPNLEYRWSGFTTRLILSVTPRGPSTSGKSTAPKPRGTVSRKSCMKRAAVNCYLPKFSTDTPTKS